MFSAKAFYLTLALTILPLTAAAQTPGHSTAKYGSNSAAGNFLNHDGINLYYEIYGAGEPLLLIHGNGANIWSMSAQIDYFRQKYRVIVMDSRDHGKSSDGPNALTFETMTDDLSALLDHLHAGPVYVLGWSDGGIEALLLGLRHPEKVKMIAAMAANLDPGGAHPEFLALGGEAAPATSADKAAMSKVTRAQRVEQLDRDEPHIRPEALEAITAPTLVLAGDHDVIRDEHTVLIYHHLPNSQLAIFPNATHMIPYDNPALFNATVDRFFSTPFVKKDRVSDTMKSVQKAMAAYAAEK